MKEYRHASRFFWLIVEIISIAVFVAGIIMTFSNPQNDKVLLALSLYCCGAISGGFFLAFFIGTAFHYILLDDEKMILSLTRVPKFKIKKNVIYYSDIAYIEMKQVKGSNNLPWLYGKPLYSYKFYLKNNTAFVEPLLKDFGRSKEKEIIDFLSKKVKITTLSY